MTSELSNRNMVIVSRGGDFWITEAQAENVKKLLNGSAKGMIEIDGNYIAITSIDALLGPEQYDILNKRRRGAYQCKYGYWHERDNHCAHHLVERRVTAG